jgi:hypothetical protein
MYQACFFSKCMLKSYFCKGVDLHFVDVLAELEKVFETHDDRNNGIGRVPEEDCGELSMSF